MDFAGLINTNLLKVVSNISVKNEIETYIVGGAVRDYILYNKTKKDIDQEICIYQNPLFYLIYSYVLNQARVQLLLADYPLDLLFVENCSLKMNFLQQMETNFQLKKLHLVP